MPPACRRTLFELEASFSQTQVTRSSLSLVPRVSRGGRDLMQSLLRVQVLEGLLETMLRPPVMFARMSFGSRSLRFPRVL